MLRFKFTYIKRLWRSIEEDKREEIEAEFARLADLEGLTPSKLKIAFDQLCETQYGEPLPSAIQEVLDKAESLMQRAVDATYSGKLWKNAAIYVFALAA